jgi:hypothetical protein
MTELASLKKNLLKVASKRTLDQKDKKILDRIMKTIKNKYVVVMVKNERKNLYKVI